MEFVQERLPNSTAVQAAMADHTDQQAARAHIGTHTSQVGGQGEHPQNRKNEKNLDRGQ